MEGRFKRRRDNAFSDDEQDDVRPRKMVVKPQPISRKRRASTDVDALAFNEEKFAKRLKLDSPIISPLGYAEFDPRLDEDGEPIAGSRLGGRRQSGEGGGVGAGAGAGPVPQPMSGDVQMGELEPVDPEQKREWERVMQEYESIAYHLRQLHSEKRRLENLRSTRDTEMRARQVELEAQKTKEALDQAHAHYEWASQNLRVLRQESEQHRRLSEAAEAASRENYSQRQKDMEMQDRSLARESQAMYANHARSLRELHMQRQRGGASENDVPMVESVPRSPVDRHRAYEGVNAFLKYLHQKKETRPTDGYEDGYDHMMT